MLHELDVCDGYHINIMSVMSCMSCLMYALSAHAIAWRVHCLWRVFDANASRDPGLQEHPGNCYCTCDPGWTGVECDSQAAHIVIDMVISGMASRQFLAANQLYLREVFPPTLQSPCVQPC